MNRSQWDPYLVSFDAPPGGAVYIGTIRHQFNMKWNNWLFLKGSLDITATNDFAQARDWFLKSNQRFATNITENIVNIRDLAR